MGFLLSYLRTVDGFFYYFILSFGFLFAFNFVAVAFGER
jgi:hypothetical protein